MTDSRKLGADTWRRHCPRGAVGHGRTARRRTLTIDRLFDGPALEGSHVVGLKSLRTARAVHVTQRQSGMTRTGLDLWEYKHS